MSAMLCLRRLVVFLLASTPAFSSFAPAHHELHKQWESVHQERRRLNVTYNYVPKFIHPEHCRYVSEEECKRADYERGMAVAERRLNPSVGTFKVLVLLIYFPEDDPTTRPNRDYFETLFNGEGMSEVNPVGSIREWLLYNSVGKYNVTFDVQDWAPTDKSAATYARGDDNGREVVSARWSDGVPLQGILIPELQRMEAAGFDFSPYDSDGDNIFDHLHVIHSGPPAELGAFECTGAVEDMIWSQGSYAAGVGTYVTGSGIALGGYTISSAITDDVCSNTPTNMAVAAHEYIHGFKIADLYDQDFSEPVTGVGGVGAFDTMSYAYGWTRDGARPGYLSPYTKIAADWLTPLVISENGLYAIQPAELSGQVYVITDPFPEGEFLYIEMRYGIKWDNDFTGAGLVIYHVDMLAGDDETPQSTRGLPGLPNFPMEHYRVSVIQADGFYDIEMMANMGDSGDFFTEGMTLGPGPSFPNTDSIQSGVQTPTGVSITVTSPTSYIMQFEVSGLAGRRQLSENSTALDDYAANVTDPDVMPLQGYVPYGKATLATDEQMKEFRIPDPTREDVVSMFDFEHGHSAISLELPGQIKSTNVRGSSSNVIRFGPSTAAILVAAMSSFLYI